MRTPDYFYIVIPASDPLTDLGSTTHEIYNREITKRLGVVEAVFVCCNSTISREESADIFRIRLKGITYRTFFHIQHPYKTVDTRLVDDYIIEVSQRWKRDDHWKKVMPPRYEEYENS